MARNDLRSIGRAPVATLADIIAVRCARRTLLRGAAGAALIAGVGGPATLLGAARAGAGAAQPAFAEIAHGVDETHHVAPGYRADVLIRWGDPVLPGAPAFDPRWQSAANQARQFGYNNDFIGFVPLPSGGAAPEHGLLCVNHEYTIPAMMFPGLGLPPESDPLAGLTKEMVEIEMAAHGASIIEVARTGGHWSVVPDSARNRRITALDTEMALSGPAAGHARLRTDADASGTRVIGMIGNCAGGITPWGTYLSAEENFDDYFLGAAEGHAEEENFKCLGLPGGEYAWGRLHSRFDITKVPNEPNRFGWIVEIDPLDPAATPVKRSALGRFKHEGAAAVVNGDGRVVLYSGDDERFQHVYRFVTEGRHDAVDRAANRDLLDRGTLAVARFDADGTLSWLPLVFGTGPLTPDNGFHSQADVVIETRRAAALLGATPMDRREDVEANPVSGTVNLILTNNTARKPEQVDAANPRAGNTFGHIIELRPAGGDHALATFRWEILVRCGDPAAPEVGAAWSADTTEDGWFASPDHCAIDHGGGLWIATDQGDKWPKSGTADGVWRLETEGPRRGTGRMFFRAPVGAEVCGPCFAPDDRALFASVQHPAVDGAEKYPGFERASSFDDPATRWPDFAPDLPPRPAVVMITKDDGGPIGS
ncbi:MAG: PhoX family phosphatase [Alphaproteobacteria bacterium]|nr:PhoX family phosphatase [Alphaproteobacteria bacterium]